jgi:hypothetical protein
MKLDLFLGEAQMVSLVKLRQKTVIMLNRKRKMRNNER